MLDSGQSSDDWNVDGNKNDKNQTQADSSQDKDTFGRRIPGPVLCSEVENMPTFFFMS